MYRGTVMLFERIVLRTSIWMMLIFHKFIQQLIQMTDYQNKKSSAMKKVDSQQSSSLEFLGTDKENQENDNQQDQDQDNGVYNDLIPESQAAKKKKQLGEVSQKAMTNIRKKQKSQDEAQQNNNIESTFLYKPGVQLPNLFNFTNLTIKVIIAAQYLSKDNPSVAKHKIFGTDTYSANSDCVCVCLHSGILSLNSLSQKKYQGVQVSFKVIKPKKNYNGSTKNGILSQTIKNYNGNAIKPESVKWLSSLGSLENLQRFASNMRIPIGKSRVRSRPQHIQSIVPLPQNHLVFNMHNEPAFKYSSYNIGDKGFNKNQFMIKKLDSRVLYFETRSKQKFELSKYIEKTYFQAYKFAKLKHPIKCDNEFFFTHHPPLHHDEIEILQQVVEWDEIIFGNSSIKLKDTIIENVVSFKFYPKAHK